MIANSNRNSFAFGLFACILALIASSSLQTASLVRRAARAVVPHRAINTLIKPAQWVAQTNFYKKHPWLCKTAGVIVAGVAAKKAYKALILHRKKQKLRQAFDSNSELAKIIDYTYLEKSIYNNRSGLMQQITWAIVHRYEPFASYEQALKCVQGLKKSGLDINEKCPAVENHTPLMLATDYHVQYMIDALIACGADVNAIDSWGNTALMRVCDSFNDHPERDAQIIDSLIKSNANLDIVNTTGDSALILAAKHRNYRTVKQLIAAGALAIPEQINKLENKDAVWKVIAEYRQKLYTEINGVRSIHGMPPALNNLITSFLITEQQQSEPKRKAAAEAEAAAGDEA